MNSRLSLSRLVASISFSTCITTERTFKIIPVKTCSNTMASLQQNITSLHITTYMWLIFFKWNHGEHARNIFCREYSDFQHHSINTDKYCVTIDDCRFKWACLFVIILPVFICLMGITSEVSTNLFRIRGFETKFHVQAIQLGDFLLEDEVSIKL